MRWLRRNNTMPAESDDRGLDEATAALDNAMAQWPEVRQAVARVRWTARFPQAG